MIAYKLNINRKIPAKAFLLLLLVNFGIVGHVFAEVKPDSDNLMDRYSNVIKATDEELAQQRGGFTLPNGMVVNISLERLIFLNGVETASSFIQFPVDGVLIQNGSGNLGQDLVGSVLGSIIQNSLDDQVIKSINELNVEISNLPKFDLKSGAVISDLIMPTLQ